jgi:Uncharacterized protein, possibly involved in aromatic compounds catabolism
MTADEVLTLIREQIPFVGRLDMQMLNFGPDEVELLCRMGDEHARPGGTISGPVMMALGDVVAYACILARNPKAKSSVTVGYNINFFRRPSTDKLHVTGRIHKMGRRMAFLDIMIAGGPGDEPVAQVTCSYAVAEGQG